MKKQIVKVSVAQSAKVLAVLYMVMSIPIVAVMAVIGLLGGGMAGMIAILVTPLIYGAVTFLCVGFIAWLYNMIAKHFGGLEFSTEEVTDPAATA